MGVICREQHITPREFRSMTLFERSELIGLYMPVIQEIVDRNAKEQEKKAGEVHDS